MKVASNVRPYVPRITKHIVEVPHADDMDNETFIKHLEKRHSQDTGTEGYMTRHNIDVWIGMYRTFHERCHRLALPGQYDHEHAEPEKRKRK